ncbi:OmpA family protein [[Eubacterium] yurii subsp. margaretiae ATCC 43715]|nr:OmpA family protein [[Eubacterium] yurii subsp. margaretiae ATCC 43715]
MKRKNFLVILFLLLSMIVIYGCSNNKASTDSTDTNVKVSDNKEDEDKENTNNSSEGENKEDGEEDTDDKKMSSDTVDSKFIVPGYKVGEIPAIEMPVLPDLLITEKPDAKFKIDVTKDLASVPGVTVTPVKIENGSIVSGDTVAQTGKGGSGQISKGNKVLQTDGDGSGQYSDENIVIQTDGKGGGQYINNKTGITLQADKDGSGQYKDEKNDIVLQVDSDGSGQYSDGIRKISIMVGKDGSATYNYNTGEVLIRNHGDGTGSYRNETLNMIIYNEGKGKADIRVNGEKILVDAEPLEKAGKLPTLSPIPAVPPIEANSVMIKLDSGVLFDVNKYDIREDANDVLMKLIDVLKKAKVEKFEIYGHTDSDDTDEYNQVLSENRANSVKDFLVKNGITANIATKGFGEKKPIATNSTKEGKQLNRRVEIIIPTM